MAFVVVRVLASVPVTPRRRTVNMSSSPSRRLAAASGWSAFSSLASAFARSSPVVHSGCAKAAARRRSTTRWTSFGR